MAVDLNDLADRSGVLELGSRPPLHPQHHAVLSLDADYRGPLNLQTTTKNNNNNNNENGGDITRQVRIDFFAFRFGEVYYDRLGSSSSLSCERLAGEGAKKLTTLPTMSGVNSL